MKTQFTSAALIVSIVVCASAPDTRAGIVPISRSSEITLNAYVEEESFDDTKAGDQFGTFDEGLAYEAGDRQGTHARGSTSQLTTVEFVPVGQLIGSGNLYAQAFAQFLPGDTAGPLQISGDSSLTVLFRVIDAAERFRADGDFGGPGFRGASGHFALTEISNPESPWYIITENNAMYATFENDVLLPPRLYRLTAGVSAGSSGSSPGDPYSFGEDNQLNFNFAVGAAAPTVIPLPAAAWSGLLMLPIAAAAIRRARRRATA